MAFDPGAFDSGAFWTGGGFVTPDPGDRTVTITINDVDVTNDVRYADATFIAQVNGTPGSCRFAIRDTGHTYAPIMGQAIELTIGTTLRWAGFVWITGREYTYDAEDTTVPADVTRWIIVNGVDVNMLLQKRIAWNKVTPTDSYLRPPATNTDPLSWIQPPPPLKDPNPDHDGQWIENAPNDSIVRYVITNYTDLLDDGVSLSGVRYFGTPFVDHSGALVGAMPVANFMREINSEMGGIWYLTPSRVLVHRGTEQVTNPYFITDRPAGDPQAVACRRYVITSAADTMANESLVWGAALGSKQMVFSRVRDKDSVDLHGLWQVAEQNWGIYRQASADTRAEALVYGNVQSRKGPNVDTAVVEATTFSPVFQVGDVVHCVAHVFDEDHVEPFETGPGILEIDLPVRRMTITFPTPFVPMFSLVLSRELDEPWSVYEFLWETPGDDPPWDPPCGDTATDPACVSAIGIVPTWDTIDDWVRADGSGWGTSTGGYPWVGTGPGSTNLSVASNKGVHRNNLSTSGQNGALLNSPGPWTGDFTLAGSFTVDDTAAGANTYEAVGLGDGVNTIAQGIYFNFSSSVHGTSVMFKPKTGSSTAVGFAWTVGQTYEWEWIKAGGSHQVRVWPSSGSRPSTPTISLTGDSTFTVSHLAIYSQGGDNTDEQQVSWSMLRSAVTLYQVDPYIAGTLTAYDSGGVAIAVTEEDPAQGTFRADEPPGRACFTRRGDGRSCSVVDDFSVDSGGSWPGWTRTSGSNGSSQVVSGVGTMTNHPTASTSETQEIDVDVPAGDFTATVRLWVSSDEDVIGAEFLVGGVAFAWRRPTSSAHPQLTINNLGETAVDFTDDFWATMTSDYAILELDVRGGIAFLTLWDENASKPAPQVSRIVDRSGDTGVAHVAFTALSVAAVTSQSLWVDSISVCVPDASVNGVDVGVAGGCVEDVDRFLRLDTTSPDWGIPDWGGEPWDVTANGATTTVEVSGGRGRMAITSTGDAFGGRACMASPDRGAATRIEFDIDVTTWTQPTHENQSTQIYVQNYGFFFSLRSARAATTGDLTNVMTLVSPPSALAPSGLTTSIDYVLVAGSYHVVWIIDPGVEQTLEVNATTMITQALESDQDFDSGDDMVFVLTTNSGNSANPAMGPQEVFWDNIKLDPCASGTVPAGSVDALPSTLGYVPCTEYSSGGVTSEQAWSASGAVYRPAFVPQLDGSAYGGLNCTCAATAIAIDRATLGATTTSGAAVRAATGDTSGGTNLPQNADAAATFGVDLVVYSGITTSAGLALLDEGRGMVLQGGYAAIRGTRWQGSEVFDENHALFVNERRPNPNVAGGYEWLVYDPLADGRRPGIARSPHWIPQAVMLNFAARLAFGSNLLGSGRLYAMFTDDTGGSAVADTAVYRVGNPYAPGSTEVWLNGMFTRDYTESSPSAGEITFPSPLSSTDRVVVSYIKVVR